MPPDGRLYLSLYELGVGAASREANVLPSLCPQTKILEDRTKDRSCLFEALFKGVSTGFGLLLVEKWFENTLQTVCSTVQNLRLGSIELLQKMIASIGPTHHHTMQMAWHAIIVCDHLANLLHKIIASTENQRIA